MLVVWESSHSVYARHRGTKSWGSVATLGDGIQSDLSAVVDASSRLSAAWKSQRVGEGESTTPAIVSLIITAAPGHGWDSRRPIESVATASGAGHYVALARRRARRRRRPPAAADVYRHQQRALRNQGDGLDRRPHGRAVGADAGRHRRGPRRRDRDVGPVADRALD